MLRLLVFSFGFWGVLAFATDVKFDSSSASSEPHDSVSSAGEVSLSKSSASASLPDESNLPIVAPLQFIFNSPKAQQNYLYPALIAAGISLLGLGLQWFFFWSNRRNQKSDAIRARQENFKDEYWMRKMFLPLIQDYIKEFVKRHIEVWSSINSEDYSSDPNYLADDFQDGLHQISKMVTCLEAYGDFDEVLDVIDGLDSDVTEAYASLPNFDSSERVVAVRNVRFALSRFEFDFILRFMKAHERYVLSTIAPAQ